MNDQALLCARMALFHALTPRQQEIAYLIGQGLRDADVAKRACIQTQTVKNHMMAMSKHLGIQRRAELVYFIAYWEGYNAATAKQRVKIVTHKEQEAA